MPKARNYKKEYRTFHAKPAEKKKRAARNKARSLTVKEGRAHKGDGKDVDHKDGNPRNNAKSNRRVISKSKNRSKK